MLFNLAFRLTLRASGCAFELQYIRIADVDICLCVKRFSISSFHASELFNVEPEDWISMLVTASMTHTYTWSNGRRYSVDVTRPKRMHVDYTIYVYACLYIAIKFSGIFLKKGGKPHHTTCTMPHQKRKQCDEAQFNRV